MYNLELVGVKHRLLIFRATLIGLQIILLPFLAGAAGQGPSCQSAAQGIKDVLDSAPGPSGGAPSATQFSRFEGPASSRQDAYSKARETALAVGTGTLDRKVAEAKVFLLQEKPDHTKARDFAAQAVEGSMTALQKATSEPAKKTALDNLLARIPLLGIQARNAPGLMYETKAAYRGALAKKMMGQRIQSQEGINEWLTNLLNEKKKMGPGGIEGEMSAWEVQVIEDILARNMIHPNIIDRMPAVNSTHITGVAKDAQSEIDEARAAGKLISEDTPIAVARPDTGAKSPSGVSAQSPSGSATISPTQNLIQKAGESAADFQNRQKEAAEFYKWFGGKRALTEPQSNYLATTFHNRGLGTDKLRKELREHGFDDVEIRMMELNNFTLGRNKRFELPSLDSKALETAAANMKNDPIMKLDSNPTVEQATAILKKRNPTPSDLHRATIEDITDIIANQNKITGMLYDHTNPSNVLKAAESRKNNAALCRKLIQAYLLIAPGINPKEKDKLQLAVNTGECSYH